MLQTSFDSSTRPMLERRGTRRQEDEDPCLPQQESPGSFDALFLTIKKMKAALADGTNSIPSLTF